MNKPVTLEQVAQEESRVHEALDELLQPLRDAKEAVKAARSGGKDAVQAAIKELDQIYNQRASLKADLVFLEAVKKELNAMNTANLGHKFG